ncbi:GH1 family beta-glucosidase [Actinomadura sp. 9N407]|uniref:GH1 family beta-glucosidase n=1 Tax=Actinomadura sp. 9N407 TaxID=3375154 RepID=UPI00379A0F86
MIRFPEGFLWGAATSAYQIEGAASADGRRPSVWDVFAHTPGKTFHGQTGDIACDHYRRWEQDLDLMAELGLKAYRFSIAWTRTTHEDGRPNQRGLDFYRRLAEGLRDRGIVPFATLYHFDLPQSVEDKGGWLNRDTAYRLAEHAQVVTGALKDTVDHWMTINEAYVESFLGYATGELSPGHQDTGEALAAAHHLLLGHGLSAQTIREGNAGKVGLATSLSPVHPMTQAPADVAAARLVDGVNNRLFLDAIFKGTYPTDVQERYADLRPGFTVVQDRDMEVISTPLDFFGLNFYYGRTVTGTDGDLPSGWAETPLSTPVERDLGARDVVRTDQETTVMGWPITPNVFTEILCRFKTDFADIPVYITENGVSLHDQVSPEGVVHDPERIDFLTLHLNAIHNAIAEGVQVKGYLTWSLMDNFEWAQGYGPRFGLTYVDFGTQRRIPKTSFHWYRDVIARNGLNPPLARPHEPDQEEAKQHG